jgi:hypothetical protein
VDCVHLPSSDTHKGPIKLAAADRRLTVYGTRTSEGPWQLEPGEVGEFVIERVNPDGDPEGDRWFPVWVRWIQS